MTMIAFEHPCGTTLRAEERDLVSCLPYVPLGENKVLTGSPSRCPICNDVILAPGPGDGLKFLCYRPLRGV